MSGEKCAAYNAQPAAGIVLERQRRERQRRERKERLKRERRARKERRAALLERAGSLSAQADGVDRLWREAGGENEGALPAWAGEPTLRERIEAAAARRMENSALEAILDELAREVAAARRDCAQRQALLNIGASLRAGVHASASSAARSSAERDRAREASQGEERALRRDVERTSRLLESLEAGVLDADRAAIEHRAEEAIGARTGRRNALIAQLSLDIQRANAEAGSRETMVRQAERWHRELFGFEGPEVEELDRILRGVAEGEAVLPPGMERRIGQAVARANRKLERDCALEIIGEELRELGYVVEEGFETASPEAPHMLLRNPDMEEGYHVSLRADPEASVLHARVVREADGAGAGSRRGAIRKRMDHAAESAWCADFATALAAAEGKGVSARLTSRKRAGEVPVAAITPPGGKTATRRKRKRRQTGKLMTRSAR